MDLSSGMKRKRHEMGDPRSQFITGSSSGENYEHEEAPQELVMMDEAFSRLKNLLKSPLNTTPLTNAEYEKFFTSVVYLATSFSHDTYYAQLYNKFFNVVNNGIRDVVLPYLQGKDNTILLSDTLEMWYRYKVMVCWLSKLFEPLEGYCRASNRLHICNVSMFLIFELVFDPLWEKLRDEVLSLIKLEREAVVINKTLINEGIDLFLEIDKRGKRNYFKNFEEYLCDYSAAWYRNSASEWLLANSIDEYIKKAQISLGMETRRLRYCLPKDTLNKMLEGIWKEMMT